MKSSQETDSVSVIDESLLFETSKGIKGRSVSRGTPFPLLPIQRGMLAESLIAREPGLNVEQVIGELHEPFDEASFLAAWQQVLDTHDTLRLSCDWRDPSNPTQRVEDNIEIPLRVVDIICDPSQNEEQTLERLIEEERCQKFVFGQAPLMRVAVLRKSEEHWFFVWTVHHNIIDGESYTIVLRQLFDSYSDIRAGLLPRLEQVASFCDYVSSVSRMDTTAGVDMARRILNGYSGPNPLPLWQTEEVGGFQRTEELSVTLSKAETGDLMSAVKRTNVTPNTFVQLAWGILLSRYGCGEDIVFGGTWSSRRGIVENDEHLVGPCINTLPVRMKLTGNPSVQKLLTALREQHIAMRPYRHTPLQDIKAALGAGFRLFETNVIYEPNRFHVALSSLPGWERRRFWSRSQTSYALSLSAERDGDVLHLILDYKTGLYDKDSAERILADYARLLHNLSIDVDAPAHSVQMLAPELIDRLKTDQLKRELLSPALSVLDHVMKSTKSHPDALALQEKEGLSITYGELGQRIEQFARALLKNGVHDGDVVAILLPRSIDAVIAMLAVHAIHAAFLPLDLKNPHDRLIYMLEDSHACIMLVDETTQRALPESRTPKLRVDLIEPEGRGEPALPGHPIPLDGLAYIVFTSGSTGKPKGVCVEHGALANHMEAMIELYDLKPSDRVLQFSSLCFDASFEEVFPTLAAGASLYLRSAEMAGSAHTFFEEVEARELTVLNLPTAFWHQMVQAEHKWPGCVRLLIIGGERADAQIHSQFRAADTAHIRFINAYGPTEATITSTYYDDSSCDHDSRKLPIGVPLRGLSHFVLDPRMRLVPKGALGQLFIGGAGLARGYMNSPLLTEECFVEHPFRDGGRLYATGDLVHHTLNGNLVYDGRLDNQVKVRGFRIELGEVEASLRAQKGVSEATVVPLQQSGSDASLVGFVGSEDETVSGRELQARLGELLPSYMVPVRIEVLRRLPKTTTWKIDRKALEVRAKEFVPMDLELRNVDPLEKKLFMIWSEILKKPITKEQASFFEIGGNSLLAVQLFTRIEKELSIQCDVAAFFEHPTIKGLAKLIRKEDDTEWNGPLLRLAKGPPGVLPLFFAPALMGRSIDYVHLAKALGEHVPVWGLQMRGLKEDESPHETLSEAARFYAEQMRRIQPEGPYAIAGFSAGGVTSVAIAEALLEQGCQADFVGVFDSVPSNIGIPSPFTSPRRFWRLSNSALGKLRYRLHKGDFKTLFARVRSAVLRSLSQWLPLGIENKNDVTDLFVGDDVNFNAEEVALMQNHLDTVRAYTPRNNCIDMVLFRGKFDPFEGPHLRDLGWGQIIKGRISIRTLSLFHNEFLSRDGAEHLAAVMMPYLVNR